MKNLLMYIKRVLLKIILETHFCWSFTMRTRCGTVTASVFLFLLFQEWNMGQRASDTRGISFEDVVVPAEVCRLKKFS